VSAESSLSLKRIAEAARVVDPVFLDSPQFVCEPLSDELGLRLLCKVDCLNPIRSFKGRGADFFAHTLGSHEGPLVAASAGNFGQGLAYACRRRGWPLILFAATTANPLKVARMRALGADVRMVGVDFDAAKLAARAFAKSTGMRFVEDGREPAIAEGAGTIGRELCAWPEPIDTVFVPIGNGALVNGVGRWFKANSPKTRVVGVVAAAAPSMRLSWLAGRRITTAGAESIADGIAVREPVDEALAEMARAVDDVVEVTEAELVDAVRQTFAALGLAVEPSGAASLAAAVKFRENLRGQLVAALFCGGNVTHAQFAAWQGG